MLRKLTCALLVTGASAFPQTPTTGPTARQIIETVREKLGVQWSGNTVDTIKAGDPDTVVTGVATTMMATHDVLRRAAAEGKNLVITHEPTFYSHLDQTTGLEQENDAVWAEKAKFIRDHKMVVWRFHDYWHMRQPDGILEGVLHALDWHKQYSAETKLVTIAPARVDQLAAYVQKKLGAKVLRVVGQPDLTVSRIALSPGAGGAVGHRRALQRPDVEVLLIGEVPEWETIEYVSDAAAQGRKKVLFLIGHIPSEQPGMENCARWLKTFINNVPVGFVPTVEPFWTPQR
ncbi:MAG TPA: Nif3-like dinuclear metal center hexameric protein [Bryobacteraceae bacterium]|nr:Nif3-like dinuclear metal center hexameric protein [Bryobacteraceae bacterium]